MSQSLDFSQFDRVLAPIMVASPEMSLIYANGLAKRQYPFLASSEGLLARYETDVLRGVSLAMAKGQPLNLPYDDNLHLSLLFEPSLNLDGSLSHVYIYVVSESLELDGVVSILTDGELLHLIRREVVEPTNRILQQLQVAEMYKSESDLEKLCYILSATRRRLLRMSLFFARMSDVSDQGTRSYAFYDAVQSLIACEKVFNPMKYKPSETCYVPMERDAMILMFTDILTNLYFRQKDPVISVSSASTDEGVTLKFASGPLEISLSEPCHGDFDGIDIGMFSVRRRVELAGGQVIIKPRPHGAVTVTLKFPQVNLTASGAIFGDPSAGQITYLEVFAMEYLKLISGTNG